MNIRKTISIILTFAILATFLISEAAFSAGACECGMYHEEPFHVGDDLISLTASGSGSGWKWNHNSRTLTLTNANISNTVPEPFDPSYPGEERPQIPGKYLYDKVQNAVIHLPPDSTIILNGKNTVTVVEDESLYPFHYAIHGVDKSLTIKGGGSLYSNGAIGAHALVFDGVTVTMNENQIEKLGGMSCYELHIKNSTIKNNSDVGFVAKLEISNGVLYTKNTDGGEMPGAIYFFKNFDTSKYDVKYKTETGYDGETVSGNAGAYTTFFKKGEGAKVEVTDIMIKGKTSSNKKPSTSTTSKKPSSSEKDDASSSQPDEKEDEVVVDRGGVKIKYPVQAFPVTTVIHVAAINSGAEYGVAENALSGVASNFVAYDINAVDGDKKAQPDGTVSAEFAVPKEYDINRTAVYYVSDSGYEKIPSTVDEAKYTIKADLSHFSIYAVVEEKEVPAIEENGSTNYVYIIIAVAAGLALVAVGVLVFCKQRGRKDKNK